MGLRFPHVESLPLERYSGLLAPPRIRAVTQRVGELSERLAGRVVWNLSSTAVGGGVAEMVRTLLAYARGSRVDARWAVMSAPPEFFRVTKRLHNALHGSTGDGSPLGEAERLLYERVSAMNAGELAPLIRPRDVVVVHDPQPAGLIAALAQRGVRVIWRCHIGDERLDDPEVARGWRFLEPYLRDASAYVFSRAAYMPRFLDRTRAAVIPPSIDPFSAKNQPLAPDAVEAILARANLVTAPLCEGCARFVREDGTPGRVDRHAEVVREGGPPTPDVPLVVQVSRWDRLKDPIGVLRGFALLGDGQRRDAHLVLAGPSVMGVADDPEGAAVYADTVAAWRALPDPVRATVHLVSLPTIDVDENAAMVNALQRHAAVVVQKSLREGFGLTVTEALWKSRPVVASAVGGIQDQIEDGVNGLLVGEPADLPAFAAAVARLLGDPDLARRLGEQGHVRVAERFLGVDSLLRYGALIERLDAEADK